MNNERLILEEKLKSTSERLKDVDIAVVKLINSMRGKSMNFYNRISLMSGGVLSLSITYIGYLASVPNREFVYAEFLFIGWMFLLVAIFSGLYRNHFNLDMGHYQAINTLNMARLDSYNAQLMMFQNYPESFINIKTIKEKEEQINITEHNIKMLEKAIKSNELKEKRNSRFWIITQNATHAGFFAGILLITLFASLNLPVKIDFTIFNYLTK